MLDLLLKMMDFVGLPKDSLSLPRDMTFAADGRLLQRLVPELKTLRITDTHEQLPLPVLSDDASVWLKTVGRSRCVCFYRFLLFSIVFCCFSIVSC